MRSIKKSKFMSIAVIAFAGAGLTTLPAQETKAGGFSLNVPFFGFHIDPGYRYTHYHYRPGYYYGCCPGGYYRTYSYDPYAPVIEGEVYEKETYGPDGRVHEESRVEERRERYESSARNEADPRPRRTVHHRYGPGYTETLEREEWIATDERPDLVPLERQESVDPNEARRMETDADLKSRGETSDEGTDRVIEEPKGEETEPMTDGPPAVEPTDEIERPAPHEEK